MIVCPLSVVFVSLNCINLSGSDSDVDLYNTYLQNKAKYRYHRLLLLLIMVKESYDEFNT